MLRRRSEPRPVRVMLASGQTGNHFTCSIPDVPCHSRGAASMNVGSGNVETIAFDSGQHGIGPAINTGHGLACMHGALADKHPFPELFRKIGAASPRRKTGQVRPGPGLEDEYMQGEL